MAKTKKSERTRKMIIEKSAPLFNRNGFAGTSMSDILKATGLTKGGVYGNFSGKEELALEAFEWNKERLFDALHERVSKKRDALDKLRTFFKAHGLVILEFPGGCPVLNAAVDADTTFPDLKKRVQEAMLVWTGYLERVIRIGIQKGEVRPEVDADRIARNLVSMLEGAVFMGRLLEQPEVYKEMVEHILRVIDFELLPFSD
ncbi:MAG: TetR family transcriptional regulator C-terminal domain-containing protein [Bacteroidota bacterium]